MAEPNLISANTILGRTAGTNLSSNSVTTVLNNAAASGKVLKINTLNVSNYNSSATFVTVRYHDQASSAGNSFPIVGSISVPGQTTLTVIDKSSQYYLAENSSLSATAQTANFLTVTVSYEDIS